MKKKTHLLLPLVSLTLGFVASCGTTEQPPVETESVVLKALKQTTSSDLVFHGKRTNQVVNHNPNLTDKDYTRSFTYNVNFKTNEFTSFETELDENGEEIEANSTVTSFFNNASGNLCTEKYNGRNEVILDEVIDLKGRKTLWKDSYSNPFELLVEEDFKLVEEKDASSLYKVEGTKAQQFLYHFVGDSFENVSLVFTIADDTFTHLSLDKASKEHYLISTSLYTRRTSYLTLDLDITNEEANIFHLTPFEDSDDTKELASFLKGLEQKNFTLSYVDGNEVLMKMNVANGEVYVRYFYFGEDSEKEAQILDMLYTPNSEGTLDLYLYFDIDEEGTLGWIENDLELTGGMYANKVTFDELVGTPYLLSANIFDKTSVVNEFRCKAEAVKYVGREFLPAVREVVALDGGGDEIAKEAGASCKAILDTKNNTLTLETIGNYMGNGFSTKSYVNVRFSDVGTTVIPFRDTIPTK